MRSYFWDFLACVVVMVMAFKLLTRVHEWCGISWLRLHEVAFTHSREERMIFWVLTVKGLLLNCLLLCEVHWLLHNHPRHSILTLLFGLLGALMLLPAGVLGVVGTLLLWWRLG